MDGIKNEGRLEGRGLEGGRIYVKTISLSYKGNEKSKDMAGIKN